MSAMPWLRWEVNMDFAARPERMQALVVERFRFIAAHLERMRPADFAVLMQHLPTATLLGAAPADTPEDPIAGFEQGWKALLSISERTD